MLERILKATVAVLIACLLLPGCVHFSSSARKQAAYQKYVRKQMGKRYKQQAKFKSPKLPALHSVPSEARVTAEASGPQSVSSAESQASE
ncbi:MAG: hypothetical protein M3R29_07120 [Verrucomicrobiota bacterium]|nr:hypothetical protein [Verrucomicrobiota bacterium]